jgi:hypothetical protein
MSHLNRRTALIAAAALPALAVPSIAIAATLSPDPIFAATEKHKQAVAAFNTFMPTVGDEESDEQASRLCDVFCEAARDMLPRSQRPLPVPPHFYGMSPNASIGGTILLCSSWKEATIKVPTAMTRCFPRWRCHSPSSKRCSHDGNRIS